MPGKGKPSITIGMLLGKPKGDGGETEPEEEMDDEGATEMPDGFEDAARQAFDAAKADDAEAFASALHDAIRLCY